ncbi:hypothetical protein F751_2420 [Auxenochlorella protothecoides]|uniref:Uncharacterized protein n=1 Tax=Auxenochlorella protothecoides TaxID=3075 RepID=A0A087SG48_AUXPR|nr:hypothetical protein F751_2420 [Auxenochlorella protothecoides]KFM24702.1 hypothetical protein F751_2420 [Auxenochlorella protothecoides]
MRLARRHSARGDTVPSLPAHLRPCPYISLDTLSPSTRRASVRPLAADPPHPTLTPAAGSPPTLHTPPPFPFLFSPPLPRDAACAAPPFSTKTAALKGARGKQGCAGRRADSSEARTPPPSHCSLISRSAAWLTRTAGPMLEQRVSVFQ